MSDKIYSFEKQLEKGKEWERKVFLTLQRVMRESYIVTYLPDNKEFQSAGFDMSIYCKDTDTIMLLEIKTDFQSHKTGNAFLETISVSRRGIIEKEGWVNTSKADAIMYLIPGMQKAIFLHMNDLRDILKSSSIPYPFRECKNQDYSSYGFLVPIKKLMEVGSLFNLEDK